jgi:hypothetical protein
MKHQGVDVVAVTAVRIRQLGDCFLRASRCNDRDTKGGDIRKPRGACVASARKPAAQVWSWGPMRSVDARRQSLAGGWGDEAIFH